MLCRLVARSPGKGLRPSLHLGVDTALEGRPPQVIQAQLRAQAGNAMEKQLTITVCMKDPEPGCGGGNLSVALVLPAAVRPSLRQMKVACDVFICVHLIPWM